MRMRAMMLLCIVPMVLLFVGCKEPTEVVNLTAPVITQQPQSKTVTVGLSVTFTVTATGNPAPSYQWRKNGINISGTSASYSISSAQLADAATYSVVVSNSEGSVTSNGAVLTVNTTTPTGMDSIPGGTFQMGQPNPDIGGTGNSSDEQPVHSVTVSAFHMDVTEVTQADYLALMSVNPSQHTGDLVRPVETLTWFDAVLYCNARSKRDGKDTVYTFTSITGTPGNGCSDLVGLAVDFSKNGYRLPTEAEWEYACRAGSTTDYYWGRNSPPTTTVDTVAIDSNAVWSHNSGSTTLPVAGKLPNAFGLYDMSGNVWEWCNDWYDAAYYSSSPSTDPTGPSTGTDRVLRGGGWKANDSRQTSAYRNYWSGIGTYGLGFRCVRR